jgi:hypothetical protein
LYIVCSNVGTDQQLTDGVWVHNIIISASSVFLRQELKSKKETLVLTDCTKEEFLPILEFIYKGEVTIDKHSYQNFVRVAKCLSITGLQHLWKSNKRVMVPKEFTTKRQKMETSTSTERKYLLPPPLKTETNITDFPVEILSKIFQHLSTTVLLQKCGSSLKFVSIRAQKLQGATYTFQ